VRRELGKQEVPCGYKSVIRAMREAGLQPKRRRPHPKTSDGKGRGNWPNLLKTNTSSNVKRTVIPIESERLGVGWFSPSAEVLSTTSFPLGADAPKRKGCQGDAST
jgi:hypothetical protein